MLRSERDERETVRATILFEIVASRFIKPFLPFPLFLLFENWILLKRYAFYISFHFLGQNSRISSGNHNLRLILSSLIKNIILVQLSSREERKVTFFLSGKNRGERKKRREGRNWRGNLFPSPSDEMHAWRSSGILGRKRKKNIPLDEIQEKRGATPSSSFASRVRVHHLTPSLSSVRGTRKRERERKRGCKRVSAWIGEWFSNPSFRVWQKSGLVENQVERTLANPAHPRGGSTWEWTEPGRAFFLRPW